MTTTRTKKGRPRVVSPSTGKAHGRALATAPAARASVDARDARVRLVEAMLVRAMRAAKVPLVEVTERALKGRIDRARADLGPDDARRLARAFAETAGPMLASVRRAHVEAREYAARSAVRFVIMLDEHQVEATAALTLLASAAQWTCLADLLRDRALAAGPGDEGFAASIKLAQAAGNAGRLDLLAALQVEEQGRAHRERAGLPAIDVAARMREIEHDRAARLTSDDEGGADSNELASHIQTTEPSSTGNGGAAGEGDGGEDVGLSADGTRVSPGNETRVSFTPGGGLGPGALPPRSPAQSPVLGHPGGSTGHLHGGPPEAKPARAVVLPPTGGAVAPSPARAAQLAAASPLVFDPARGRIVPRGDAPRPSAADGPTPHALAEMRRKGLDTNQWEQTKEKKT